jgi:hypothetical protein
MPESGSGERVVSRSAPLLKALSPSMERIHHLEGCSINRGHLSKHLPSSNVELTGFRGYFPLGGERSTNGKEAPSIISAGFPA